MTGKEFLDILCSSSTVRGLSDKSPNDTVWRATVLGYLNLIVKNIRNRQQTFHWRWLEKTATMPTVANQHSYDLPTDIDTNKILSVYDRTNNRTYVFKPYDEFVKLVPNPALSTGGPYWYTVFANTLRLYPTPSSVITVFMDYVKKATSLADNTSSIEIPDKYDDVVIDGALRYVYGFDPDMGSVKTQILIYEAGVERMVTDNRLVPDDISEPVSHRPRSGMRSFRVAQ